MQHHRNIRHTPMRDNFFVFFNLLFINCFFLILNWASYVLCPMQYQRLRKMKNWHFTIGNHHGYMRLLMLVDVYRL